MARKDEAVQLLRNGNCPSAIARTMGISVKSVIGYLYNQVGEGRIRRSDIVFSISPKVRLAVEEAVKGCDSFQQFPYFGFIAGELRRTGFSTAEMEDAEVYCDLRSALVALGDMYEWVYEIEVFLHRFIRAVLISQYGEGDLNWWRRGVPEQVRLNCVSTRECDPEPAREAYCYTTFIHLKKILEQKQNWPLFVPLLPDAVANGKKELLEGLETLNGIRNRVMHPSKGMPPSEEDFLFVHSFLAFLTIPEWRWPQATAATV